MTESSQTNPRDRNLKKINAEARHRASQRGVKEQEKLDEKIIQTKL
jgi:hypothetical protein